MLYVPNHRYTPGDVVENLDGLVFDILEIVYNCWILGKERATGLIWVFSRENGRCVSNSYGLGLVARRSEDEVACEKWSQLDADLRVVILAAAQTKKIAAIKYLRSVSRLGPRDYEDHRCSGGLSIGKVRKIYRRRYCSP